MILAGGLSLSSLQLTFSGGLATPESVNKCDPGCAECHLSQLVQAGGAGEWERPGTG